ncbi:family S53 protease-like protein [Favolaschia claudopus]|uniref:Family S53 protease-like protein n=1 Tax=Favolaschia claudopus TaxID=2862362 RepID=A0AAW0CT52_9AGAR
MAPIRSSIFFAFVAVAVASAASPTMIVHESRAQPAHGFIRTGPAPDEQQLKLRIALKSSNIPGLESEVMAVSDPTSSRYGQHLTPKQVADYVRPTAESVSAVTSWLKANNISATSVTPAGNILQFQIPVSQANSLLNAEFSVFEHQDDSNNETSIRTLQYSVPADLSAHISYLQPTTSFSTPRVTPQLTAISTHRSNKRLNLDPSCADMGTPACLQAAYGIPSTPATQKSNILGVSGFFDESAKVEDTKDFLTKYRPEIANNTFEVTLLDDARDDQLIGGYIDVQYAMALATDVPLTYIGVGFQNPDGMEGFLDQVNTIINMTAETRPTVLSTSAYFNEDDYTLPMAQGLCEGYLQLSALGISTLFSSGRFGVAGASVICKDDGNGGLVFAPSGPSGCPWVTSVGTTQLVLDNYTPDNFSEIGSPVSAGGFSNYFPIPEYQKQDVVNYLATSVDGSYKGLFNATGRGFPDVSAAGLPFETFINGFLAIFTDNQPPASTPVFAAVIALLNDELIANGKSPLGFLNPFLYSADGRAALNDITEGKNPGCGTSGFNATVGWDPVTGLGSPNYSKLRKAVGLPDKA